MKRFFKIGCLAVFGLLALGAAGLTLFIGHVRRTVPPWPARLPGVRLEPARPTLREADVQPDNAYYYIRQLTAWTNSLRLPKEWEQLKACGYGPKAQPVLDAWFASNAAPLELCRQAAALTNCQVATVLSANQLTPYIGTVMSAAKMLTLRAERSAERQEWPVALAELRTALHLGNHVSRGGPLINSLVGMSCGLLTCRAGRRIALTTHPPADFLRAAGQYFQTTEEHLEPFSETMRYEWAYAHEAIKDLCQQMPNSKAESMVALGVSKWWRALISEKQIQYHLAGIYSHLIAFVDGPPGDQKYYAKVDAFLSDKSKLHWYAAGDIVGRVFVLAITPAVTHAKTRYHAYQATLRGTQIFLAVCAFRQEHGQLPKTLEELVPAYLPKLPADPFAQDGQTFRYRVEQNRWLIYSIGPDQKDDGGQYDWTNPEERSQHETDLLFASDEFDKARARYLKKQKTKPAEE